MSPVTLLLALSALSAAEESPTGGVRLSVGQYETLSDEELARLRGGFSWSGVTMELGAEVRSYLDDELVMQTNISWTDAGAETTRFISTALEPATASALTNNLITGSAVTFAAGDGTIYLANDGHTAFVHRTDDALQNVVLNAANGASLRQEMDVQIDLNDMGAFESSALAERIGTSLSDTVSQSLIGGL